MAALYKNGIRSVGDLLSHLRRWPFQLAAIIIGFAYFIPGLNKIPCLTLNCSNCPWAVFGCPVRFFQDGSLNRTQALYSVGVLGVTGLLVGKFACGWFCPFGLLQDWLYKIKVPKLRLSNRFGWIKYAVLIILVGVIPYLTLTDWFCKLCPVGTLEAVIPLAVSTAGSSTFKLTINYIFVLEMVILGLFLVWMVFSRRPFCRFVCPLGAIYSIFNRFSGLRLRLDKDKCIKCNKCQKVCPVEAKVYQSANNSQCIRCLECVKACPKSAIKCTVIK